MGSRRRALGIDKIYAPARLDLSPRRWVLLNNLALGIDSAVLRPGVAQGQTELSNPGLDRFEVLAAEVRQSEREGRFLSLLTLITTVPFITTSPGSGLSLQLRG